MGSSSQPSRTTQVTEPPAFIRPFMEYGAQQSRALYETGGPQYYGGNTVVPFSQQTEAGLGAIEQRAINGSPVNQAAQQYATGILGSTPTSQFGGASNPYLDAQFNRAADSVQQRLQSGFAGTGRNIEAARPAAAQELNDLATGIYGGAYENERNRMADDLRSQQMQQLGVAQLAPTLAAQDYADYDRLLGVGGQVEDLTGRLMEDQAARWDFSQNAPQMNLDNYIARVTGAYPGQNATMTTPTYRNRLGGALGGGMLGYSAGTAIGAAGGAAAGGAAGGAAAGSMAGPWGALIGAGLGYLMS